MLLRILILIMLLLVLPDTYIYIMYIRRWTKRLSLRLLCFLPSLLLAVAAVVIMSSNDMKPEHQSWVGMYMLVFLIVCIPKTLFMVCDIIGHFVIWIVFQVLQVSRRFKCIFKRGFRILGMTLSIMAASILCLGYFVGRHYYVVHQQSFYFPDLPQEFEGYCIAQFSDMHIGTFRDGNEADVRKIVDLINRQQCDAILFVGDLVNHQSAELDGFKRDLSRLKAPDGVFAVMGNHDYSMYIKYPNEKDREADVNELQRRIKSYGWTLLLNEHRTIHRRKDSIVIAGIENDGRPPFPSYGDLKKTMKGVKDGSFTVLLSHDPTAWQRKILPQTDIQLTLSGHTHAGQFKVFGWSPVAPIYTEWSGAYSNGRRILNVSDGIGAVMFPFRFGAWPEVNVITLHRGIPQKIKGY
ncbi:MAG: metallophosphoesterase [Prevotellaceae bacterium]|nr:metallophosphoesterase [Prevotellaceae bacterium]